jgi:precorrin-4 methylase
MTPRRECVVPKGSLAAPDHLSSMRAHSIHVVLHLLKRPLQSVVRQVTVLLDPPVQYVTQQASWPQFRVLEAQQAWDKCW